MIGKRKTVRWKFLGGILCLVVLIAFAVSWASSALDGRRDAELQAIIEHYTQTESIDRVDEKVLADAYWRRYPDVAADKVFGADGALGVFGAREHFNRHGRAEKREWGP